MIALLLVKERHGYDYELRRQVRSSLSSSCQEAREARSGLVYAWFYGLPWPRSSGHYCYGAVSLARRLVPLIYTCSRRATKSPRLITREAGGFAGAGCFSERRSRQTTRQRRNSKLELLRGRRGATLPEACGGAKVWCPKGEGSEGSQITAHRQRLKKTSSQHGFHRRHADSSTVVVNEHNY